MLPTVTSLLAVATVYGQFHHALDACAGAALGAVVPSLRNLVWRGLPLDAAELRRA